MFTHHPIHSRSRVEVGFCSLPTWWLQPPARAASPLPLFFYSQGVASVGCFLYVTAYEPPWGLALRALWNAHLGAGKWPSLPCQATPLPGSHGSHWHKVCAPDAGPHSLQAASKGNLWNGVHKAPDVSLNEIATTRSLPKNGCYKKNDEILPSISEILSIRVVTILLAL